MTTNERLCIENDHFQKYGHSCPGSTVEMLLKIKKAIPANDVRFQDSNPSGNEGVGKHVDQEVAGNWTLRRIPQPEDWQFPLDAIKQKLSEGETVAIFENPAGGSHGWLVDEISTDSDGDESVLLRSKYSEDGKGSGKITATMSIKVAKLNSHRWSDPIFLEAAANVADGTKQIDGSGRPDDRTNN